MNQLNRRIKSDLKRYNSKFLRAYILIPGFKYMFFLRLIQWTNKKPLLKPLTFFLKLKLLKLSVKYGIQIPWSTNIGKGFYIGHFGSIIVNGKCVLGNNVNISQGVTLGQANRGRNKGYPIIGNRVYIGPGVKIIGNVTIGDDVAIGANAVVTHNVPNNACVAGVPAKIISMEGSLGYINNISN